MWTCRRDRYSPTTRLPSCGPSAATESTGTLPTGPAQSWRLLRSGPSRLRKTRTGRRRLPTRFGGRVARVPGAPCCPPRSRWRLRGQHRRCAFATSRRMYPRRRNRSASARDAAGNSTSAGEGAEEISLSTVACSRAEPRPRGPRIPVLETLAASASRSELLAGKASTCSSATVARLQTSAIVTKLNTANNSRRRPVPFHSNIALKEARASTQGIAV